MSKFTDSAGRDWILSITVGEIKRVRERLQIDLADVGAATADKLADPVTFADVLWALVEPSATQRQVSANDFGRSLAGDPSETAMAALLEAITDFFPGQRRLLLRRANEQTAAVRQKATALALAKLDAPETRQAWETAIEQQINAQINAALTRFSLHTNSPDKSAE